MIQALSEPVATQASVADKYGVSRPPISKMWKSRVKLRICFAMILGVKRSRLAKEIENFEALFEWFRQKGSRGARVSGPTLIEKAKQLADDRC